MQQIKPGKKTINPRELLSLPQGREQLASLLQKEGGYVPQKRPLLALCNAIRRGWPLLCEGARGGGKTALGEALAKACNLPLFYLQCMDGLALADLLFSWDTTAQDQYVRQQTSHDTPLQQAQAQQWTLPFVVLGEVLAAFQYASLSLYPPVLIVDEADKLNPLMQDALLQVLACGYADIPRLRPEGLVGMTPDMPPAKRKQTYPIVILTSNNMRGGISSPLRSRNRVTFIKPPNEEEEVRILRARAPAAPPALLLQTVKLLRAIRRLGTVVEKPGLRESIEFLLTLIDFQVPAINAAVIEEHLDCLAKTETDMENMLSGLARLERSIQDPDAMLEELVQSLFPRPRVAAR
jgi:MoxR-like ATPase